MPARQSALQASQAIQQILQRGADIFYDKYLLGKLPSHLSEKCEPLLYQTCQTAFTHPDTSYKIKNIKQPIALTIDSLMSKKMRINQNKVISISLKTNLKNRQKSSRVNNKIQPEQAEKKNKVKYNLAKKKKVFTSLTIFKNKKTVQEAQMLKQLQERRNKCHKMLEQAQLSEKEIEKKKKNAKDYYKSLQKQGPINYNFEGRIFSEHISQSLKNNANLSQDVPKLQFMATGRKIQQISKDSYSTQVTGRKRGYTSCEKRRRIKMTNQQFNNDCQRQISTIPFLTIQPGIKLIEKQKDVSVQKISKARTKDLFNRQTQNIRFRSYHHLLNPEIMRVTLSSMGERKNKDNESTNFNTLTLNKTSRLTRAKTTRINQGRIKINDEELAQNMCFSPCKIDNDFE